MERRTFVKGAFGLTVLAVGTGLGVSLLRDVAAEDAVEESSQRGVAFTTPEGIDVQAAVGPLMQGGIELVELSGGSEVAGYFGPTELFRMNPIGAMLVMFADGTRTINQLAADTGAVLDVPMNPASVASFFVTLGEAGFLQNTVLVNLLEIPA